jgi:Ca2+-binding RTX toxin-like protein
MPNPPRLAACAAVVITLGAFGLVAAPVAGAAPTRAATRPSCHGLVATIVGTRHRDVIHASAKRDVIVSGRGWDKIYGGGGSDVICAGWGADVIYPGDGNDWVDAGHDGNLYNEDQVGDRVFASHGNDVLHGGPGLSSDRGLDQLIYSRAKHRVRVDLATHVARILSQRDRVSGFEIVHGTVHDDVIFGTDRFEELFGGAGNDIIKGRGAIDFVNGERGNDRISGGPGNDALSGGPGQDIGHAGAGEDFCTTVEVHTGCEHLTR